MEVCNGLKVCRQPCLLSNGDSLTQPGRKASNKGRCLAVLSIWPPRMSWGREHSLTVSWFFWFFCMFYFDIDNQMFNTIITSNSIYSGLTLPPSENLHTTVATPHTQGLVSKTNCHSRWQLLIVKNYPWKAFKLLPENQYIEVTSYNKFNAVIFSSSIETDCCFLSWTPSIGLAWNRHNLKKMKYVHHGVSLS